MSCSKTFSAFTAVLISAILWGFIGVFSRNLAAEGFSALQVTFTRMLIGLIVLAVALMIIDRTCFRIRKKDLWIFVFFGIFKILSDLFLFKAQVLIHISLSAVLQLTSPYWVLLFSVFLFNDRLTPKKLFAVCMAFFGCVLVTGVLSEDVTFDTMGVIFALISGLAYATYTVGNKVLMDRGYSSNTVIFYIFLITTIMCIPIADIPSIPPLIVDYEVVLNLLGMGILMTLVPYYLQIYALKYISPVAVNVIGLIEVASAVVVGMILYGEGLGWMSVIGMILIPLSVAIMNIDLRRAVRQYEKRRSAR